ncbi:deleted in malignant brain tumors 1 protein-like, partial [Homarus americanus]
MTGLQPDGNNTSGGGIEPYYSIHSRRSTRKIVPCGSDNTLVSGEELIFQSQNYPDNYPNSHTCSWSFTNADQNAKLIVVCDPFSTQKNKDKLMFEESGGQSNVAELPKVSGRYNSFTVKTTTNSLTVTFTTSRKDAFTGFSCTVASTENQDSTSSQPSSTTMPSSTTKPSCGKFLKTLTLDLSDPMLLDVHLFYGVSIWDNGFLYQFLFRHHRGQ